MSILAPRTPHLVPRQMFLILLFALAACSSDSYDAGDSEYSYMRADFVIAHTDSRAAVDYVITDDDSHIYLEEAVKTSWTKTPDSLYRALIYYNNVKGTPAGQYPSEVKCLAMSQVITLTPMLRENLSEVFTDPLIFESAWLSKNGKFLNIGFAVKTGRTDGYVTTQDIGVCIDSDVTDGHGNRTIYMQIMHNQKDAPEYYSSHGYASIPIKNEYRGATLHLSIPTYNGTVVKEFSL